MGEQMKNPQGLTMEELFEIINDASADMECFKRIGYLSMKDDEKYQKYKSAYDNFIAVNGKDSSSETDDNLIKGKALEDLVSVLFETTGEYYEVYRNLRNGSNEVDLFVQFSNKGRYFKAIIGEQYQYLLCECKNYKDTVSVTYIGKFYSLMKSTSQRFGIVFSHDGFSGESWGGASGLSKKLFLLDHGVSNECILDFNKNDFKKILEGESFFDIIDNKCKEMELGIDDILKYKKKHPNEE